MASYSAYTKGVPVLTVAALSVSYDLPILRNVNFQIKDIQRPDILQGQKTALLGRSGRGKTQLFKRISGLLEPNTGEILIGREQKKVKRGMVGLVPQDYRLFPDRTVESSLMLAAGRRFKGKGEAKDQVHELANYLSVFDKLNCYPHMLSGGQRQRCSIAEQLLSSENFILMDEPFSGLDVISKKSVCDIVDRITLRDELNTIIFSTHDIESAVMLADTIVVLGFEQDTSGADIPGATVIMEIDLIERGLAWNPRVETHPNFVPTVMEIKELFKRI